jgi:ketosteroid isomerase-like protein
MTSQTGEEAIRALSKVYFDAIENNDVSTPMDCLVPDVEIWHNADGKLKGRDYILETMNGAGSRIKDVKYSDRRLIVVPGGLVQQHVVEGVRVDDGGNAHAPACLVCKVHVGDDGKARFAKMEVYYDSAHLMSFYPQALRG